MWLVSLIALLGLIFSFFGGVKDGAVKAFFGLVALVIAIPLAGISYHLLAGVLSFLPGNWGNFLGFFITLGVIALILHLIFFLPRKILQPFGKIFFLRPLGGLLSTLSAAIGIVVFPLVLMAYPVWGWLEEAVTSSDVVMWLVANLGFVQWLLPEVFRQGNII